MQKVFYAMGGIILLSLTTFIYQGCKNTDHPLGVYAPNGLDVPSPTPTPITGSIEVYVNYQNADQVGVTVQMVDPNGVTLSSGYPVTTQPYVNYAPFNPTSLTVGQWKAIIPQQGNFNTSIQAFNVTGPGQFAVTFTQGLQVLSVSPVSQTYSTSAGNNFLFGLNYNQTGNLNVPVSVTYNSLPNLWSGIPLEIVLSNAETASVTFTKLGCDSAPVSVTFSAKDFSGLAITQTNIVLIKGYPLPVTLSVNIQNDGSGTYQAIFQVTSNGDCGVTYNLSSNDVCYGKNFSANDNLVNGQSVTYRYGDGSWNNACGTYTEILTTPYGPITWNSGALSGGNFNGVAISTNY
jgi:hypothetical protein